MEAASQKLRTIIAIVATIVVGAAMIQAVAPGGAEPAHAHPPLCPPNC